MNLDEGDIFSSIKVIKAYRSDQDKGLRESREKTDISYSQGVKHCLKDVISFLESTHANEEHLDFFRAQLSLIT